MKFQDVIASIPHQFTEEEKGQLERAYEFAKVAHGSQLRSSGEEYITHPSHVASILGQLFPDTDSITAAFLHDVPEDTSTSLENIKNEFGEKVAELVDGVTKLGKVRLHSHNDPQYLENLRKLFVATSRDVRVMLIKLADRLHNMRTIEFVKPEKQRRIAIETLEVYAPIASRLGIGAWKDELEDRSFRIVDPERWEHVRNLHQRLVDSRQEAFDALKQNLNATLSDQNITFNSISGRVKKLYSLHKKLQKPGYKDNENKVADIIAFRIITSSIADCYAALGAIHQKFQPAAGSFKDYISLPKPNGYQSLHTTVFDDNGGQFEIQIRTDLMHEQAERGVAAHWFYTQSGKQSKKVSQDQSWANELRAWQEHEGDPDELLETLKLDLFSDRIFVLTPNGDVINLPLGATPIDFAFRVHSDLGFYMTGAKINGKMASIYDELEQGDMVEILKTKNPVKMSRDWLLSAKTSHARQQIKHALSQQTRWFSLRK